MHFERRIMRVERYIERNRERPSVVSYCGVFELEVPEIYGFYGLSDAFCVHGSAEWRCIDGKDQWVNVTSNPYNHKWTEWYLKPYKPIASRQAE
jgi:hypothetical protein